MPCFYRTRYYELMPCIDLYTCPFYIGINHPLSVNVGMQHLFKIGVYFFIFFFYNMDVFIYYEL